MKNILSSYSLAAALFAGTMFAPATVTAADKSGLAELAKVDKPVFLFKATGKDPYSIVYRPGSNVLEFLTYGYYPGKGSRVFHVTKSKQQLKGLMPIRMVKLYIDGPVKIDEKYAGYRESALGQGLEDMLVATSVLPEHVYKGTPFLDQYLEAMPFKMIFNNTAEISSLREYLQPLFEESEILAKNLVKPVLVVGIDHVDKTLAQDDSDFLNTYFTVCDPSNEVVKAFFDIQQDPINKAIALISDTKTKQVKETFAEMVIGGIEKSCKEFKTKEAGALLATMAVTALTTELLKQCLNKPAEVAAKKATDEIYKNVVQPRLGDKVTMADVMRNGLLVTGGIVGTGLLVAAAANASCE